MSFLFRSLYSMFTIIFPFLEEKKLYTCNWESQLYLRLQKKAWLAGRGRWFWPSTLILWDHVENCAQFWGHEEDGPVKVGPEGAMKMIRWLEYLSYAVRLNTRTGCPEKLWMPIPGSVQGQVRWGFEKLI